MRSVIKYTVSFLIIIILAASIMAAEKKKETKPEKQGSEPESRGSLNLGAIRGPGTEAKLFDDDSLVFTPVPTTTPIYSVKTPEKEAWSKLVDTKALLNRCNKDLVRYDKSFRKDFMESLNSMGTVVGKIHTEALLDKRDLVENDWENQVDKTEHALALAEEWANEFNEDYAVMEKNQARVKTLLKSYKNKIQQPNEVELKYSHNDEEMFYVKKKIDTFNALFANYVVKYRAMIKTKEDKVNKLLNDHYELYKP